MELDFVPRLDFFVFVRRLSGVSSAGVDDALVSGRSCEE